MQSWISLRYQVQQVVREKLFVNSDTVTSTLCQELQAFLEIM